MELVNLPKLDAEEWPKAAEKFIATYGPLRRESSNPEAEAVEYGRRLREVWKAALSDREIGAANSILNDIFKAGDPIKGEGPAITADLSGGCIAPSPRSFLHELALELLDSKRSLGQCDFCKEFFIKQYSRDKTCSVRCSQDRRNAYMSDLMAERRAKEEEKN